MQLGEALAEKYGVSYLPSDFKKKDGYKESIRLSQEYELYRQDYCGSLINRIYNQIDGFNIQSYPSEIESYFHIDLDKICIK